MRSLHVSAGACTQAGPDWPERVVRGLHAAISFAATSPEQSQLLFLDAVASEPLLANRALVATDQLIDLLRLGRDYSEEAAAFPELTEKALVGAMLSVIGSRIMPGQVDRLFSLEPQLLELMLMPYVGFAEARRLALCREGSSAPFPG